MEDNRQECPKCGSTPEIFTKTGKFGCDECYKSFPRILEDIVFPYQVNHKKHTGKVPKKFLNQEVLQENLKVLLLKKARALEHGNFIEAAQFRYEIAQLRKKIK